jgi:Glucose-regulated metallo-peptidase M90
MPLSKVLSIIFALVTLALFLVTRLIDTAWAPYILIGFLPLALSYIMSAEIDWWWYERNPPELEPTMARILENGLPFYQQLDTSGKKLFGQKVCMFIIGNAWEPQVWETIPRDTQVAIAAQAIIPIFDTKHWVYPRFQTIVVFPEGFMSPTYPFTHDHELNEEDNCLIFNGLNVLNPIMHSANAPYAALYEYTRVALKTQVIGLPLSRTLVQALEPTIPVGEFDANKQVQLARYPKS